MKTRLSLLYFLQFGIWGCYLTCFGQLLGRGGLGSDIAWFYAAIGLVSILTPPLFGRLADRTGRPELLLAACHIVGAAFMFGMWHYGMHNERLSLPVMLPLYIGFLLFYMPTMALANTTTFGLLTSEGKNPSDSFPSIRIWGTIGFIVAMWFVNSAYYSEGTFGFAFSDSSEFGKLRFQYTPMQLLCSAIIGLLTAFYTLTLPRQTRNATFAKDSRLSASDSSEQSGSNPGLINAVRLIFANRLTATFLVFVVLTGACLQISNGFATPFITHFSGFSDYVQSFASGNATFLFSLSQISEAVCVLLVGVMLQKGGIRSVYALGLLAWSLRFLLFAFGNPGDGLWMLVLSMVMYGFAFNFITIAGHLHIQKVAPEGTKGFAQGLMMFMSNGIGATIGTLVAGNVVNHYCHWENIANTGTAPMHLFMGDWEWPWLIFAAYSAAVMIGWLLLYRKDKKFSV